MILCLLVLNRFICSIYPALIYIIKVFLDYQPLGGQVRSSFRRCVLPNRHMPASPATPDKRSTSKPAGKAVRPLSPGSSSAASGGRLTRGKKSRLESQPAPAQTAAQTAATTTALDQRRQELESFYGNDDDDLLTLSPAKVQVVVVTKSKRRTIESSDSEVEVDHGKRDVVTGDKEKKKRVPATTHPVPGKAVGDALENRADVLELSGDTSETSEDILVKKKATASKAIHETTDKDKSMEVDEKKPATGYLVIPGFPGFADSARRSTSKGKAPKRDIIAELLAKKKAAAAGGGAGAPTPSSNSSTPLTTPRTTTATTGKGRVAEEFSLANMLEDRKRRQQRGADLQQIEKILSNKVQQHLRRSIAHSWKPLPFV